MAKWHRDKAPGNVREVKAKMRAGRYGLKPCPNCGRMNGMLDRDDGDVCAIGRGCRPFDKSREVT